MLKKTSISRRKSFILESSVAAKSFNKIKNGENLRKENYSSRGGHLQFFKIIDSKTLRWCANEKNISNLKKCHSYDLSQIKGLVYGKCTSTFLKSSREKLEPWLCMSLIMDSRPFDIFCTEENINDWYIGLAHAIKKHNPNSYCLSPGRFFWRKMKILMTYLIQTRMTPEMKKTFKRSLSFTKLILIYKKMKFSDASG